MITNWYGEEELRSFPFFQKLSRSQEGKLRGIARRISEEFESGEIWLETPSEQKQTVTYGDYRDFDYILIWAHKRGLFYDPNYSKIIRRYLFSDRFTIKYRLLEKNALLLDLVTKEEMEQLKIMRNRTSRTNEPNLSALLAICLFAGKKLKQISDKDITSEDYSFVYELFKVSSKKGVQDYRIYLGYSNHVVKRNYRSKNLESLYEKSPTHAEIVKKYLVFLKLSGYSKSKRFNDLGNLTKFLSFLNSKGNFDFSTFEQKDFIECRIWLEENNFSENVIYSVLTTLKSFFSWGINQYKQFPKKLDMPFDAIQALGKNIEEKQEASDGRAFPIEGLAEKIALAIYAYKPQNEIEGMCRDFWLIASSCPVRFEFIRNLSVECMHPVLNDENLFALTSEYEDKAGNVYGEFPIFDNIGIEAVGRLQNRVKVKKFNKIKNPKNKLEYIHLFQLDNNPYILSEYKIRDFLHKKIVPQIPEIEDFVKENEENKKLEIGAHGFRHHIATFVQAETRDIKATQFCLGHHDEKITKFYLRSKFSRNTVLASIIDAYDKKELSGKFYLRLIDIILDNSLTEVKMFEALTSEIELSTFLKQYGRKRDMGWCMATDDCATFYRCWGCHHFLLRREEIEEAINKLANHYRNHNAMIKYSKDFSYDNPVAAASIKKIALIQKRVIDLGLDPEKIWEMVKLRIQGNDIREVLKDA